MASGVKFVVRRDGGVLRPQGEYAYAQLELMPERYDLMAEIKQRRNPNHHKKYWLILSKAAFHVPSEIADDAEELHEWIKLKLRMVKDFKEWDGKLVVRTKSISVESMDQLHFAAFYERAMHVLRLLLGFDPEELLSGEHHTEAA